MTIFLSDESIANKYSFTVNTKLCLTIHYLKIDLRFILSFSRQYGANIVRVNYF